MGEKYPELPEYVEEEIDIYELFLTIKKHIKFLLCFVIIITLFAGITTFFMHKVYKTKITIKIISISYENGKSITFWDVKVRLDHLNDLIEEHKYTYLSKFLKLPIEQIQMIKEIKVLSSRRSPKDVFSMEVYTYSKDFVIQIIEGILYYIKNGAYIKRVIDQRIEEINLKITKIESGIKRLIKLKEGLFKQIETSKIIYLNFNPIEMEEQIIELETKLNRLKFYKELIKDPLIPLYTPTIPDTPYQPKKKLIAAVAFVSSLFLAIFIIFFMEWLSKAKQRYQKEIREN